MLLRLCAALLLLLSASTVRAGSSNSLLDVTPDGNRLLAVNADNGTVTVVDLKARKAVHEIKLGDKPEYREEGQPITHFPVAIRSTTCPSCQREFIRSALVILCA